MVRLSSQGMGSQIRVSGGQQQRVVGAPSRSERRRWVVPQSFEPSQSVSGHFCTRVVPLRDHSGLKHATPGMVDDRRGVGSYAAFSRDFIPPEGISSSRSC